MESVRRIILLTFLFAVLYALCSCAHREPADLNRTKDAEEILLVENAREPKAPLIEARFIEDLSITKPSWWPWSILVDDEGKILVFSGKDRVLDIFDQEGNAVFSKAFSRGQAPGEFSSFDPYLSKDNRLYIVDGSQRRLTIFDAVYEIQNIRKLSLWGDNFRLDSLGSMYFLQLKFLPHTTDRQKLILTKCSPEGIPLHEVHGYEWGVRRDINGIYHTDAFRTQIKYKIDEKNNVYYALTDRYEINVVSPDGARVKRITKKGSSRELTPDERESFKPKKPNPRFVTDIPGRMPYIADLFVLKDDFLLVITFESFQEDAYLIGDVFDGDGIFRARVQVPRYHDWNFLLAPRKGRAIYKNGHFYTIESDEYEENFWIKRYKLSLNHRL